MRSRTGSPEPPPPSPRPTAWPARIRLFVRERRRLLIVLGVLLVFAAAMRLRDAADAGTAEASLAAALANDGLEVDPAEVVWLEPEVGPLASRPVIFAGRREGEAADLYYAEARVTGGGAVLDVSWATNVTRTSSAAEARPVRAGDHLLFVSEVGGALDAVVVLDLRGEPDEATAGWPRRARVQNAITNLQETGRLAGFGRRRYGLAPPAERLSVRVDDGRFVLDADGTRIVIDPARVEPAEGADRVEVRPTEKAQPGMITWVVDTVRNLSFVGPEPIEWLEHRVFSIKDRFERMFYGVVETDTAADAAADLGTAGMTAAEQRARAELSVTDPEIGWPPAPADPVMREPVRGEGEWIPVVDDPFVQTFPGAPTPFYQTFVRADPDRAFTRVYITIFDPRQVQLHIVSGTREPESATGETGSGMAPRDDATMRRIVGGFNGGFQALHGEFGMMADGRVYLPPKPWAATVAVFEDGRVAMGSWLPPPRGVAQFEERWAVEQIPEGMLAFRQNLTSVVEDGHINPWRRWWWGAAPLNANEQTFIDRSGLCLTREGFLAYFWGKSMGADALGRAMNSVRCIRGIHLDMNSSHTGFEFYRVQPASEPFPPLGRALDPETEYEGPVPDASGYVVRARKGVRSMTPMRFPRYIARDPRDFFYLTLEPVLPGAPIEDPGGAEGAGEFSTAGLPHAGWPHAFARAFVGGAQGARTWLVRVDASRAIPAPLAASTEGRAIAWLTGARSLAATGAQALYATRAGVGWAFAVGAPPEGARVIVRGEPLARARDAVAAIGVDRDGFLVYAERQAGDRRGLRDRLEQAGAAAAIALPDGVRLAFQVGDQAVSPDAYVREVDPATSLPLLAEERPRAEVLFPEVRPRPYGVWARMQDSRVRYFREGEPRFQRPEDAGVP